MVHVNIVEITGRENHQRWGMWIRRSLSDGRKAHRIIVTEPLMSKQQWVDTFGVKYVTKNKMMADYRKVNRRFRLACYLIAIIQIQTATSPTDTLNKALDAINQLAESVDYNNWTKSKSDLK
jgi:hypothetical protein